VSDGEDGGDDDTGSFGEDTVSTAVEVTLSDDDDERIGEKLGSLSAVGDL